MSQEVHGTLENWYEAHGVIYGEIYGDTKPRFEDGTPIHTSKVMSKDGDVVTTRNSVYRLGKPLKKSEE